MQVRLMIAHEHELIRAGIVQLFHADPDIVVVSEGYCGEVADLPVLFNKLQAFSVDVLLLGMSMPALYVAEVIARIRGSHPDLPVLVLGMENDILTVIQVMKAGASGFISMHCTHQTLLGAIRKVATAGQYLAPEMAEKLMLASSPGMPSEMESFLADQHLQIFPLNVTGTGIKSVSDELPSDQMDSTHRANILSKLGLLTPEQWVLNQESFSKPT